MAPLLAVLWMVLKRHQDPELYDKSSCFLSYRDCYVVGKDPFDPFGASFDDGSHSWNETLALPIVLIRFKQSGKREDHPALSAVTAFAAQIINPYLHIEALQSYVEPS